MTVIFHPSVQRDVSAVLAYYDAVAGPELGNAFFDEFMARVYSASQDPTKFHLVKGERRRANFRRFPYHLLFRCINGTVRILVVRHNSRHPMLGLKRN